MDFSGCRVYVIDDDPLVRQSIAHLLTAVDLSVETFSSADEFLEEFENEVPSCLVLDVRLPRLSGIGLQDELKRRNLDLDIIMISGHSDLSTAVRAMKNGAVNFLEKPFKQQELIDEVQCCLAQQTEKWRKREREMRLNELIESLTPREHQSLLLTLEGLSNKEVARRLGISPRTAEGHRANLLKKMQVSSAFELQKTVADGFPRS